MQALTALEIQLLENLTEKYPEMKSHLPHLQVAERKLTSSGLDVYLEYSIPGEQTNDTNALFSNGEKIEIKGLKEGLSYVIDITMGQITSIEFSTYNEKWDGKIMDFKIVPNELS